VSAFLQGIGQVVAGTFTSARLSLSVPATLDVIDSQAVWELLDQQGRVWTQGEPVSITIESSQTAPGQKIISSEAQISVPSNLPANDAGSSYQLRWTITLRSGQPPLYAFENFVVLPPFVQAQGASDAIELNGDTARVQIRLPVAYQYVEYECYRGNSRITAPRSAIQGGIDAEGTVFLGEIPHSEYEGASLDPLTVIWSYWNGVQTKQRETTQLFIATPVILDAVKDMSTWLNRAYTDSGTSPGTTFQPSDYIKHLRFGRDAFNAAVKPTNFTMTAAAGPIRWFWINYSCVAACRAQYLAEGMKAFNYAGQTVQLDIDRTPFWDQTASALEAQLDQQIKPYKDNLAKIGALGGDGSNTQALRAGAVGCIGITLHGASPMRNGLFGLGSNRVSPFN
jgi:hypothetical protein